MSILAWILAVFAGAWVLLYFRVHLLVWTGLIATLLLTWTYKSPEIAIGQWIAWTLFAVIAIPLNVNFVRRKLISNRLLRFFKSALPPISKTEQEALEAGTVWWDAQLFSGAPRWKQLLDFPKPSLTEDEQAFLDGPVDRLCKLLDDWKITHEYQDLPPEVWQFLKDEKLFGMIIPKQYGGLEISALAHSTAVMKISSRSLAAAVTIMVPNSLGPAELLLRYGTQQQRDHYLPKLACGEEIPCFALTGPEAGSDAGAMPDTGVICKQDFNGEKDVLGIRLNWEKRYITLGPVATVLGLAFHLYDPDHLHGDREDLGITLALIPTHTEGVSIGRRHFPLNIPFQNGPNFGNNVFIPMEWIIGGEERIGQGWKMLMECLAAGRSISLPALATGACKLASHATGAYARIRRQFKQPIGKFEGIQEALARIAGYSYQSDAVRETTVTALDHGEQPAVLSAIAKYNLTERMRSTVNDAMDIHGGSGISMGPRNLMGRVYQALPIGITVEGANILTRSMIIFGQGAIRCHPYIRKEIAATRDTNIQRGQKLFDRAFFKHIGFTLSNVARTLFLSLTGGRLVPVPVDGPERRYYQKLTQLSSAFALVSDMSLLILGGTLKRKEMLSGRLADVLSQLYIASTCLKRYYDQGQPSGDIPLVQWSCEQALYEAQQAMSGLLRNYPVKPVAFLLRRMIYPFGLTARLPSDSLCRQVADILLSPSDSRDRLSNGIYLTSETDQPIGRYDDALIKVIAAESIEGIIRHAIRKGSLESTPAATLLDRALNAGLISQEQARTVRLAESARRDAIKVDDFPQNLTTDQTSSENNKLDVNQARRQSHGAG